MSSRASARAPVPCAWLSMPMMARFIQRDAIRRSDARIIGEDRNSGISSGSVAALPTPPFAGCRPEYGSNRAEPVPPKVAGPLPEPTVTPARPTAPANCCPGPADVTAAERGLEPHQFRAGRTVALSDCGIQKHTAKRGASGAPSFFLMNIWLVSKPEIRSRYAASWGAASRGAWIGTCRGFFASGISRTRSTWSRPCSRRAR